MIGQLVSQFNKDKNECKNYPNKAGLQKDKNESIIFKMYWKCFYVPEVCKAMSLCVMGRRKHSAEIIISHQITLVVLQVVMRHNDSSTALCGFKCKNQEDIGETETKAC